jgi:hypothetical protein
LTIFCPFVIMQNFTLQIEKSHPFGGRLFSCFIPN